MSLAQNVERLEEMISAMPYPEMPVVIDEIQKLPPSPSDDIRMTKGHPQGNQNSSGCKSFGFLGVVCSTMGTRSSIWVRKRLGARLSLRPRKRRERAQDR